jgi:catechol 2,3-dioxygenase-like lactoylglutathione lyase family enzyme
LTGLTPGGDTRAVLNHVIVDVTDYDASKRFYTAALAPLGIEPLMDFTEGDVAMCGFGSNRNAWFWIARRAGDVSGGGTHVAFEAETRGVVQAFYDAALAAGGRDNGAPGLREQYHPTYYGAYVLDPDGYNIEAVTHSQ